MNHSHALARDTDVLSALRTATATRHEQLDRGLPLSASHPGLADYGAHLRMLRDWLAPIECWLAGFADGPQAEPTLPRLPRLALIASDLGEPGMLDAPPRPQRPWPAHASVAYRWGVAYVIEGSQLGGAVLYSKLSASLAPHPLRYLRGEAGGPAPRWRAFMRALREHVTGPDEVAQACAGACAAFDAILELAPLKK